jgi:hypothetical protein
LNLWEVSDLSSVDVSLMSSNELSNLINKELSGLAGHSGLEKTKRLGGRTD